MCAIFAFKRAWCLCYGCLHACLHTMKPGVTALHRQPLGLTSSFTNSSATSRRPAGRACVLDWRPSGLSQARRKAPAALPLACWYASARWPSTCSRCRLLWLQTLLGAAVLQLICHLQFRSKWELTELVALAQGSRGRCARKSSAVPREHCLPCLPEMQARNTGHAMQDLCAWGVSSSSPAESERCSRRSGWQPPGCRPGQCSAAAHTCTMNKCQHSTQQDQHQQQPIAPSSWSLHALQVAGLLAVECACRTMATGAGWQRHKLTARRR